jgi:hypothetical protein
MAINRISYPASTPTAVSDYQQQNVLIQAALNEGGTMFPWSGTSMVIGAVFAVGGTVYRVDTATSISGTASNYVKITPAGATASASFVASLTGVSWSTTYNGYYDGSGNLYLFDEALAVVNGAITTPYLHEGRSTRLPLKSCGVGAGDSVTTGFAGGANAEATTGFAGGTNAEATTGGAAGNGASTEDGFAGGFNSSSVLGGAIGNGSTTTTGGAAGSNATSNSGFAGGSGATETDGGAALGFLSTTTYGASVGYDCSSSTGAALGYSASATNGLSVGSGAVSGNNQANLFSHVKYAYFASTATQNEVYDFLSPLLVTTGRVVSAIGIFGSATVQSAQRSGASAIQVTAGGAPTTFTDGSATTIGSDLSILLVKGT